MALQDGPHARGGDDDAHGGQLAVDATVAPSRVLLRQAHDERGGSLRDARTTGTAVRIGPALRDKGPVPAQQSFWSDEEAPESPTGQQMCEPRHHRPVGRLQRRSVDLASEDRHLVAQHDDLDGEIRVTATDQSDELQDAAERPVEEREGHRWMLAAPDSRRQSAVRRHRWHSRHPQVEHDHRDLPVSSRSVAGRYRVRALEPHEECLALGVAEDDGGSRRGRPADLDDHLGIRDQVVEPVRVACCPGVGSDDDVAAVVDEIGERPGSRDTGSGTG